MADLRVDGAEALRHAYDADHATVVRHGGRGVKEVGAERVAVAFALRPAAAPRHLDLGARRVRKRPHDGHGRVGEQASLRIHHDYACAEVVPGTAHEAGEPARLVDAARRAGSDHERLSGGVVLHLRVDPAREVQRERHLERDDDQDEHVRERKQQLRAELHSTSSGVEKRKPTPRTVCT
jgi:hypothetical protein